MHQAIPIETLQFLTLHQQIFHTGLQIGSTERFRDIIIRTIFQSFQFTFNRSLGSKQDNRYMAGCHIRTQFTRHFDTVFLGHHHVTDNNIREILQCFICSFPTIGSFHYPVHRRKYTTQEFT